MPFIAADAFSAAQLCGYVAFALGIAAFWQRDDRRLRILVTGLSLAYSVHFGLLGNTTAVAGSLISACRSWLSIHTRSRRVAALIIAANLVVGYFLVSRWLQILPLAGSILGTLAMFFLSGIRLRLVLLAGTFLWLANNLLSGSIGGSALELMIGLTNSTTIVRMLWARRRARAAATVSPVRVSGE